jgi:plasmid maintenance system antidote protein VapI
MNNTDLKKRIKYLGLKQTKVAELIGVDPIHLSGVLNGKRELSEELRLKIKNILLKYE